MLLSYIKFFIARALFNRGKYEKAYKLFDSLRRKNPEDVENNINTALCLMQMHKPDEAIKLLEKALEIDDKYLYSYEMLAYANLQINEKDKARSLYEKLIELDADNFQHYCNAGQLYGKNEATIITELYHKCLELNPDFEKETLAEIYTFLALAYYWAGKNDKSEEYYLKALKTAPNYSLALNNYGFLLSKLERYDEAINLLNQCLEIDPEFAYAHNNLGYCLLKTGKHDKALKEINRSIKLDPENSYAYKNRALYYLEKGEKQKAVRDLKNAKKIGFTAQYGDEVNRLLKSLSV